MIETVTFDFRNNKISYVEDGHSCSCHDSMLNRRYADIVKISCIEDTSSADIFSYEAMLREGDSI